MILLILILIVVIPASYHLLKTSSLPIHNRNFFKKSAVAIGIAIVFPIMIYHGASILIPQPQKNHYDQHTGFESEKVFSEMKPSLKEQANPNQFLFDKNQKTSLKNFSYLLIVAGYLAILIGAFLIHATGTGLILGGIFTLLMGIFYHRSLLIEEMKFLFILIAFILLLGISYYKLERDCPEKFNSI